MKNFQCLNSSQCPDVIMMESGQKGARMDLVRYMAKMEYTMKEA